jgi:hypothetical protein
MVTLHSYLYSYPPGCRSKNVSEKSVRRDSGTGIYVRYLHPYPPGCRSKNVSEESVRRDSGMVTLHSYYTHTLPDVEVRM